MLPFVATSLICGLGGAVLAWNTPGLVLRVAQPFTGRPHWLEQAIQRDPQLGYSFAGATAITLRGEQVALTKPGQPTVVWFVRLCGGCSIERGLVQLDRQASRRDAVRSVVVVVRSPGEEIEDYWRRLQLTVPVLIDTDGSLGRLFNAVFLLRAYVLDRAGRLLFRSQPGDPVERVERQIGAELSRAL